MMDRRLLRRFLEVYPYQPATAVWRAAEIAAVRRVPFPPGLGLDLGCGDGRLTRVLSEEAPIARLAGFDVDPLEVDLARGEGLYERVYTASGDRIPEADTTFDFVVSISVMEHIPSLEPVLAEVRRVLKPAGRLIATVPGPGFHACLRGPLLPLSRRDTYLTALDRRVAHLRYWTTDEWRRALQAAGLQLAQATPIMSAAEIRRWESISRVTAGLLSAAARGKRPIEIQRSLGLRRRGQRLPAPVASLLATILATGLRDRTPAHEREAGCLLIVAERS